MGKWKFSVMLLQMFGIYVYRQVFLCSPLGGIHLINRLLRECVTRAAAESKLPWNQTARNLPGNEPNPNWWNFRSTQRMFVK